MNIESIRAYCLSLPNVTEDIQWEHDLLFRIGGKIFAVLSLDPSSAGRLSFKCTPGVFAELTEREGIIPAPYVGRYHWIALRRFNALREPRVKELIEDSYNLVVGKLPKRVRRELLGAVSSFREKRRFRTPKVADRST